MKLLFVQKKSFITENSKEIMACEQMQTMNFAKKKRYLMNRV